MSSSRQSLQRGIWNAKLGQSLLKKQESAEAVYSVTMRMPFAGLNHCWPKMQCVVTDKSGLVWTHLDSVWTVFGLWLDLYWTIDL